MLECEILGKTACVYVLLALSSSFLPVPPPSSRYEVESDPWQGQRTTVNEVKEIKNIRLSKPGASST